MSYSCTVKSSLVLEHLEAQMQAAGNETNSSNGWTCKGKEYFFERGQEQDDGAITGTVYLTINNLCYKKGPVRIEPNGFISRFPTSNKTQRNSAMTTGLVKFHEIYGGGWKADNVLSSLIGDCSFVVV